MNTPPDNITRTDGQTGEQGRPARLAAGLRAQWRVLCLAVLVAAGGTSLAWWSLNDRDLSTPPSRVPTVNRTERLAGEPLSSAHQQTIVVRDEERREDALNEGVSFVPEFVGTGLNDNTKTRRTEPGWTPPQNEQGFATEPSGTPGTPVSAEPPGTRNPEQAMTEALTTLPKDPLTLAEDRPQRTRAVATPSDTDYTPIFAALVDQWSRRRETVSVTYAGSSRTSSTTGQGLTVTPPGASSGTARTQTDTARVLIPTGAEAYAHVRYGINSDLQTPVVLGILGGPLAGGVLTGAFEVTGEAVVIRLDQLAYRNRRYSVEAYAVGLDCGCFALEGAVDHHFFGRVLIPAAARFVEGFLLAAARPATSLTINGVNVLASDSKTDTRDHLFEGLARASGEIVQLYGETTPGQPTVRIRQDTELAVVFVRPVIAADLTAGIPGQAGSLAQTGTPAVASPSVAGGPERAGP